MRLVFGDDPRKIPAGVVVAVDTETTGLQWYDDMLGVSLAWMSPVDGEQSCYTVPEVLGATGEHVEDWIVDWIFRRNPTVFHNLGFDYRVLYKSFGVEPANIAHDTVHLARSVAYQDALSLTYLYTKYVGEPPDWWLMTKYKRSKLKNIDAMEQYKYARFDAVATLRLFNVLWPIAQRTLDMSLYLNKDLPFMRLVCKLISRGVPMDRNLAIGRGEEFARRMAEIAGELGTRFGINNVGSDVQVGKMLAEVLGSDKGLRKTEKTKRVQVSEEALSQFAHIPEVQSVIEYRQLGKGISSWIKELLHMSELDGRVRSVLSPFGTASFRMSSSKLNMQGVPMKHRSGAFGERAFGSFTGVFATQDPDEELWQVDIKQAEFRLAAMLSKEMSLAKVFSEGTDPYKVMARMAYGDESRRQDAKRAALASIYETGAKTFSESNHVSLEVAREVLSKFKRSFPNIKEASRYYEGSATATGYVELMTGRRRYFGPGDELYKAFNQRVQGSLAEVMDTAMLGVEAAFPGRLLLQIHDSMVLTLPRCEEHREDIVRVIREIVSDSVPDWVYQMVSPKIPFLVDVESWEKEK